MTRLLSILRCWSSHRNTTTGNVTTCTRPGCTYIKIRPRRPVRLTPAQRRSVAAWALLWDHNAAARLLGISLSTQRTHMADAQQGAGVHSGGELLDALGWVTVPDDDVRAVMAAVSAAGKAERRVA